MKPDKAKVTIKTIFNMFGLEVGRKNDYEDLKYKWLNNYDIKTILDIGSNEGQFAIEIRKFLPKSYIVCFEPIQDIFLKLNDTCKGMGYFKSYNFGLGDFNGESLINRSSFSQSSSMLKSSIRLKEAFPQIADIVEEKIYIRKLDDIVSEEEIELIPELLVKIDVQGYEDRVIKGGLKTLENARVVLIEVSFQELYEEQVLFEPLNDLMKSLEFEIHGIYNIGYDPDNGLPLYGDAIYLKRET